MNIRVIVVACIVLALAGCSDRPSESEARGKLEDQIKQQSNGLIKLISFSKTDAAMHEMMGVKGYEMFYAAEIEFVENCIWSGGNDLVPWDGTFNATLNQGSVTGALSFSATAQGLRLAAKGQRLKFTGKINLEKTESGWH